MNDTLPKLTVSELTSLVKTTLEGSFYNLTVEGEISGFKPASTGHWYFSLKDEGAVINAVIWRSTISRISFTPKDGQRVVVKGSISVYGPRGTYQIVCTSMEPFGEGDILAMLEQRKRYYSQLGYFDESLKKPIPKRPNKVAIITSPTGAALQDILQITGRRSPNLDLIILPAVVQGPDAAKSVALRIQEVNNFLLADVIIVGRGGGSIEDLLPFSEDCVIEAIHQSFIPVISAVGHEIDWALSDFVADLRAPTPSAAAELVCESTIDQQAKVESLRASMKENIASRISAIRLRVATFSRENAKAQLENKLSNNRMRLDYAISTLKREICNLVEVKKTKAQMLSHKIEVLSPLSILGRGYGILTTKDGKTLRSIKQVKTGDIIDITLADGNISACIEEVKNGR